MKELILIAVTAYLSIGGTLGVMFSDAAKRMEENAKVRVMVFVIMLFAWPHILRWIREREDKRCR